MADVVEVSVERIIDSISTTGGVRLYQIRWVDSWVSENSLLSNCGHLISAYWESIEREMQQTIQSEDEKATNAANVSNGNQYLLSNRECDKRVTDIVDIVGLQNQSTKMTSNSTKDLFLSSSYPSEIIGGTSEELKQPNEIRIVKEHATTSDILEIKEQIKSECQLCGKVLSSKRVLKRHMILKHLNNGKYQCQVCERRFTSQHELNRHMPVHTNVKAFNCQICEKSYKQSAHLMRHLRRVHEDGWKPQYQCDICCKNFSEKNNLLLHQPTHGTQGKLYKCSFCSSTFKHPNSKYTHTRRSHSSNTEGEVCSICSTGFLTKRLLNKHMKTNHSDLLFQCPYCPSKYSNKIFFKKHIDKHENSIVIKKLDLKRLYKTNQQNIS